MSYNMKGSWFRSHNILFLFVFLLPIPSYSADQVQANKPDCFSVDGMGESRNSISSSFQWENDIGNSDRYYTNGMRYTRTKNPDCNKSNFDKWIFSEQKPDDIVLSTFSFGMNMYTPETITEADPQPWDRPWTGWLYMGRDWKKTALVEDKNDRGEDILTTGNTDKVEVLVGFLGSWARQDRVQKAWHVLTSAAYPLGWDNQKPGELGLNVNYTHEQNLAKWDGCLLDKDTPCTTILKGRAGAMVGNVITQASVGLTLNYTWNVFSADTASYIPSAAFGGLKQIVPSIQYHVLRPVSKPLNDPDFYAALTQSVKGTAALGEQGKSPLVKILERISSTPEEAQNALVVLDKIIESDPALEDSKRAELLRFREYLLILVQSRKTTELANLRRSWYRHSSTSGFLDVEARGIRDSTFISGTDVAIKHGVYDFKLGLAHKCSNSDMTIRLSRLVRTPEFVSPLLGTAPWQHIWQLSLEWDWGWVERPNLAARN